MLPSSARLRRRLAWGSIGLAAVGAVALVVLLLPQPKPPSTAATGKPGSAQVEQPVGVRVRPADRRAIDKILDRFIPDAVGRHSMTTAWRLAGPELKAGSTLRQWRNDVSPIPYYPVAGKTFHNWTTIATGPNYVEFALLVFPRRGAHLGAWGFSGEVVRRGSQWLVNRLYTAATFDKTGAQTGPDVTAGYGGSDGPASKPVLGRDWLIAIICTIVLVLMSTPAVLFGTFVRDRRRRRRSPPQPLPPLPLSVAVDGRTRPGDSGKS